MSSYRYLEPAALARVRNLKLVARSVVEGFIAGLHASPYKGFSSEFAEHREYVAGDNLRHLDWRVVSRTDRYYIRQYEEETNLTAQIVLDASGSMAYGSGALTKFEYGCYLAAVLAYLLTRQRDSVGLTIFDERIRLQMPARSSPRHLHEMLKQLEACQVGGPTRVADVFHVLAESFSRRCLLIVISDLYDDPEAVLRSLHHFRHKKHEVLLYHVLDKSELELDLEEASTLQDLETGEQLPVDPVVVRDDYRLRMSEFIAAFRRECARGRVDYLTTDTEIPYDFMLGAYLAKRMRLR
jgi:uncharacterized protein (DUF58 family)